MTSTQKTTLSFSNCQIKYVKDAYKWRDQIRNTFWNARDLTKYFKFALGAQHFNISMNKDGALFDYLDIYSLPNEIKQLIRNWYDIQENCEIIHTAVFCWEYITDQRVILVLNNIQSILNVSLFTFTQVDNSISKLQELLPIEIFNCVLESISAIDGFSFAFFKSNS